MNKYYDRNHFTNNYYKKLLDKHNFHRKHFWMSYILHGNKCCAYYIKINMKIY